ncbi:MAG: DUF4962 domain-containing protein, partial [Pedobacter sp.]
MKIFLAVFISFLFINSFAQQSGVKHVNEAKLHARVREWPYPANGITVPTNAPALLWPGTNGKNKVLPMESGSEIPEDPNIGNVRYKVMLATDPKFKNNVISGKQQR